jgi:hypothetical protein
MASTEMRAGHPLNKPRLLDRARDRGERITEPTVVPLNEGNEVMRDESETSELAVVPRKWGNRPEGPHRGKGAAGHGNRWRER